LKYYDGFGKDVSDYVASLEKEVSELKMKLNQLLVVPDTNPLPLPQEIPIPVVMETESIKPKRKRSKKKINANPE